jgi:hypothetical protein
VQCRAYSTAGYGNATTQQNPDQPPLDIEDPQVCFLFTSLQNAFILTIITKELHATPPQQQHELHKETQQTAPQSQPKEKKVKTEREKEIKQQRKEFNRGDQDSVRQYSQGCD